MAWNGSPAMKVRPGWRGWVLVAAVALVLAGCRHKDSVVPPVAPTASPSPSPSGSASPTPVPVATLAPTSVTTSEPLADAGGSIVVSAGPGQLAGMLVYPSSTTGGSDVAEFALTTTIPTLPNPQPTGTALVAFELQLPSAWTFSNGLVVSPVVFPSGFTTTGLTFYETVYDTSAGTLIATLGPASTTTESVVFAAPTPAAAFTANVLDTYAYVVSACASCTTSSGTVKY